RARARSGRCAPGSVSGSRRAVRAAGNDVRRRIGAAWLPDRDDSIAAASGTRAARESAGAECEDMRLSEALRALADSERAIGAALSVEERLRREVRAIANRRRLRNGLVDALLVAAALIVAIVGAARLRHAPQAPPASVAAPEVATAFMPLPYSTVPVSNGVVVRLELPRAALASFGL